ncbi:MAG: hypothetical protein WCR27_08240 [Eubacteriales bacterium]
MICPVCGGRSIGKVGVDQYYCWDCCIEFNSRTENVAVFELDEDGSLIAWEDFHVESEVLQAAME